MKPLFFILIILTSIGCSAQKTATNNSTNTDTLRGSITPQRAWWDLNHYDLSVVVDIENQSLSGKNIISYTVLKKYNQLQLDLQAPMEINNVVQNGEQLEVKQIGDAYFISLKAKQKKGSQQSLEVYWKGKPRIARRPPWDGGITWTKDNNGNHFVASANQGIGASIWWPNKDHPADEVDSLDMHITVPKGLTNVSNGRLVGIDHNETTETFHWTVKNPINNYGVNLNIGDYTHFNERYQGEKGVLDMDYWVLRDNLDKAKEQFKQAPMMMEAFEHWFGPYPFYEDSFKLVEAPYLGMEHQSSVTYGNQYENGYLGRDLSNSGWGLKFDFIIIHEAGHEWFANNITNNDVADMWIHEGFTAYSECLYLDYHYGKQASREYVIGTRSNVTNDRPIIGTYGVNKRGSGDMYYKGSNILHMIRTLNENDELWRQTLRGLNRDFYHQTVSSKQVENYISQKLNKDLSAFFNQYLRTTKIPLIEYKIDKNELSFRYTDIVKKFDMPVQIKTGSKDIWIFPSSEWKTITLNSEIERLKVLPDFYVYTKEIE